MDPSLKCALLVVGGLLAVLIVTGVVVVVGVSSGRSAPTVRTVTIDGGGEVSTINLWDDYQTRSKVTGRVPSGTQVRLLQRSGDGCEVQAPNGDRGWVTCANFIKEFK